MRVKLFDFQKDALAELQKKLSAARSFSSINDPQAISFSAPTGSGKTIVMAGLFENLFVGDPDFNAQPDAVVLWISDMPELNEQTRLKIEGKSDRIRARQLITIDATFDAEKLEGGHVYFMNTQKLGSEKKLTKKGDSRQFSIWETLTNTAHAMPDRFYVVIDEAHRGMKGWKDTKSAQTIMQKFLLGSDVDGLCRMPLVVGVTATPKRFEELLSGAKHTTYKVYIEAEDVRESGLLKDRILIHYPEITNQAEMALLCEATTRWQAIEKNWLKYCSAQGESVVLPILVVQVEDGTENKLTKTDLSTTLSTLESVIGRRLNDNEVGHTFNDTGALYIDGRRIRRLDASRIEEEKSIGVVLFKMSLSTGWDCPRAEVMMSFRRAQDHTYIAQLLGRMVRTPLARRVESDASLNDVHLFLPHYNQEAVSSVIQDLKNVEDVPPSVTGTSRELVTLSRRTGTEDIFEAMAKLITYRVNAFRKQSSLRRLMALGRGLTHDQIDEEAQKNVTKQIVDAMTSEIEILESSGILAKRAKQITSVDLKTIAVQNVTNKIDEGIGYQIDAASADIDRHFQQAGNLFGNGLHMEYWKAHSDRDADEVKVELFLLSQDIEAMKKIEAISENEFDDLYKKHKKDIVGLKEKRRKHYEKLVLATAVPKEIEWVLPEIIDFQRSVGAEEYDGHLFLEEDGKFCADLGTWEEDVLNEELSDPSVVGWLRNVDRKPWALEIPYRAGGGVRPMFPDLVIVRKDGDGFYFDILEPHNHSLSDNFDKCIGLAEFANKHWTLFSRIQLIRKMKGHYFRLDVSDDTIRKKVMAITNNSQLDKLFEEKAIVSAFES